MFFRQQNYIYAVAAEHIHMFLHMPRKIQPFLKSFHILHRFSDSIDNKTMLNFINSKDIRQYLLHIGYSFTTVEAAWIVYKCHTATLRDKYDEWKQIIAEMPDQSVNSPH